MFLLIHVVTEYREKGKVIGGTKGNKILDYVSGAPTKERVIEQAPNVFDYDELTKYGYGVSSASRIIVNLALFFRKTAALAYSMDLSPSEFCPHQIILETGHSDHGYGWSYIRV